MPRPLSKARQQKDLLAAIRDGDMENVERWCSYALPVDEKVVFGIMLGNHTESVATKMLEWVVPHLGKVALQQGFKYACIKSHGAAFELLLPLIDPKYNFSESLRLVSYNGIAEMVQRLLPISDPTAMGCVALKSAAEGGHWSVLDQLMSNVEETSLPQEVVEDIVRCAARAANVQFLRRLLPFNSQQLNGCYVVLAAEKGNREVVDLLYPHSDVFYIPSMLRVSLERNQISQENCNYLLHYNERQTHQKIVQEVEQMGHSAPRRKIYWPIKSKKIGQKVYTVLVYIFHI